MNSSTDHKQIAAAAGIAAAIAEAIREMGSVPSGHLYAHLMSQMSLESYEAILALLIRSGVVRRESSHLLVWTGTPLKK